MIKNLIILLFLSLIVEAHEHITVLTHSSQKQTYIDQNGDLRGKKGAGKRAVYVEIVYNMLKRLNRDAKMTIVPFKRGFKQVQLKNNIAFFNVSRTSSRENLVNWVGPISEDIDYFYKLKENQIKIDSFDDAKKVKKICILNGGVHDTILKKENFDNLYYGRSYENCLKLLYAKRVQLVISAKSTFKTKIKVAGLNTNKIAQTPVIVLKSGGYIAMSKNIPKEVIQKWQNTLNQMKQDELVDKIYQDYGKSSR